MTPEPSAWVLQAEALTKSFGVVKALQQVDLDVRPGSLHAVVGHNGAGKSTLMNLLSGVYPPDSGQIRISGKPVRFTSPRDAMNQGVSMVHQELSIIPRSRRRRKHVPRTRAFEWRRHDSAPGAL